MPLCVATAAAAAAAANQGVRFGVFGLGNKQYEHFNAVGKKMHSSMEALGATPVCRRGDGDDDDSIDDDFEKWCTDLFAALDAEPELLGDKAEGSGSETIATYRVELLPGETQTLWWALDSGGVAISAGLGPCLWVVPFFLCAADDEEEMVTAGPEAAANCSCLFTCYGMGVSR